MATLTERCFYSMRAPGLRVSGYHVPYPPTRIEEDYRPTRRPRARRGRPRDGLLIVSERVFDLPDVGEGLTEAEIVAWKVAVGDAVTLNQPIVDIETAKATVELPSPYAGVVKALHGNARRRDRGRPPAHHLRGRGPGDAPATAAPATAAPAAEARSAPAEVLAEESPDPESPRRQAVLIGYGVEADEEPPTRRTRRRAGAAAPAAAAPAPPRRRPRPASRRARRRRFASTPSSTDWTSRRWPAPVATG